LIEILELAINTVMELMKGGRVRRQGFSDSRAIFKGGKVDT
jgi:hypothetical protein